MSVSMAATCAYNLGWPTYTRGRNRFNTSRSSAVLNRVFSGDAIARPYSSSVQPLRDLLDCYGEPPVGPDVPPCDARDAFWMGIRPGIESIQRCRGSHKFLRTASGMPAEGVKNRGSGFPSNFTMGEESYRCNDSPRSCNRHPNPLSVAPTASSSGVCGSRPSTNSSRALSIRSGLRHR
jgi:hypothetical protein